MSSLCCCCCCCVLSACTAERQTNGYTLIPPPARLLMNFYYRIYRFFFLLYNHLICVFFFSLSLPSRGFLSLPRQYDEDGAEHGQLSTEPRHLRVAEIFSVRYYHSPAHRCLPHRKVRNGVVISHTLPIPLSLLYTLWNYKVSEECILLV